MMKFKITIFLLFLLLLLQVGYFGFDNCDKCRFGEEGLTADRFFYLYKDDCLKNKPLNLELLNNSQSLESSPLG